MSSVLHLREFISERLTAAAGEIFSEFEKTIVQYEEEIDRQRRLLDISWKAGRNFHTAEFPQQHERKEEEVLTDQQLLKQKMNSSLDQEEPEPPQMEEDQEEVYVSHEGEQLVLKGETDMKLLCKSEPKKTLTEFQPGSIQYEEETDDQLGMSNIMEMPEIRLHRINVSDQRILKMEENLTDQQLCNQEMNCSLDQEEPEPPQIKEYLEQQSTNQEGDQLVVKQETETFTVTPDDEDSNHTEAEADSNQLFSHNVLLAELHVQEANRDVCSGSTLDTEQMMDRTDRRHNNNMGNSSRSDGYHKNDKFENFVKSTICGKASRKKSPKKTFVHTREKSHSCSVCGKCFAKGTNLTVHMRTHTGEKPFSCEMCLRSFAIKSTLITHMRTHTGEKPYSCKMCGKGFCQRTSWISHMRTHTGEKPYCCHICGKGFCQRPSLTSHIRTHTGEKPYSCKICGKDFAQSNNLNIHMRTHVGK